MSGEQEAEPDTRPFSLSIYLCLSIYLFLFLPPVSPLLFSSFSNLSSPLLSFLPVILLISAPVHSSFLFSHISSSLSFLVFFLPPAAHAFPLIFSSSLPLILILLFASLPLFLPPPALPSSSLLSSHHRCSVPPSALLLRSSPPPLPFSPCSDGHPNRDNRQLEKVLNMFHSFPVHQSLAFLAPAEVRGQENPLRCHGRGSQGVGGSAGACVWG